MHIAINFNNPALLALLLNYSADVNAKNKAGLLPIDIAINKKHWNCFAAFPNADQQRKLTEVIRSKNNFEVAIDILSRVTLSPTEKNYFLGLCARHNQLAIMIHILAQGIENPSTITPEIPSDIGSQLFLLISNQQLPDNLIATLAVHEGNKEALAHYIGALDPDQQRQTLTAALDASSPLGKFFEQQRGVTPTNRLTGVFKQLRSRLNALQETAPAAGMTLNSTGAPMSTTNPFTGLFTRLTSSLTNVLELTSSTAAMTGTSAQGMLAVAATDTRYPSYNPDHSDVTISEDRQKSLHENEKWIEMESGLAMLDPPLSGMHVATTAIGTPSQHPGLSAAYWESDVYLNSKSHCNNKAG